MPSPKQVPDQGLDPLTPIEQLARWLLIDTLQCALGLLLGVAVARLMRDRHLHWSWAAATLVLFVLIRANLEGSSATLEVAALSAALVGRRWHRQDFDAGCDLAELASNRRGPLDVLQVCLRIAIGHLGERMPTRHDSRGELPLGVDEHSRKVSIPFHARSGGSHTLVVGATGSGKTVTQTWMAARAIEGGMGAVVVDPKGDLTMREEIRRAANAVGRPFLTWTPDGPTAYNPYARGSESEIADKVLAGERFTEPHYLRQSQRYLGHVVRALRRTEVEVSLREIVDHLDPARLEGRVRELPEADAQATHDYLDSLTARQLTDLAGVRDRLAILTESDIGVWLDPSTSAAQSFDLLTAVRERAVVYFSLESDRRPLLTQMLAGAIVQDLQSTVAALQRSPVPTLVVIDEFSAVAAEQVVRLFGRARSAGFSLLLGTQELSDLRLPGRERLLEQVMGNLSVLIAHRQVVPRSAELIASVAGTRGVWKVSHHSDGRSTRTRVRDSILDANHVMRLGQGWSAVIVLDGNGRTHITQMFAPWRTR